MITNEQIQSFLKESGTEISTEKLEKLSTYIKEDFKKIMEVIKENSINGELSLLKVTNVNNDLSWSWDFKIHFNCFVN